MSQFSPPPPPGGLAGNVAPAGPPLNVQPSMSAVAVVALVASLVFCVPFVTQVVGLICGVIGIASTSGGRRRGRGLAIAAIPISLIVAAVWCGLGYVTFRVFGEATRLAQEVQTLLRTSGEAVAVNSTDFYTHTSKRFQQQLTQSEFAAWVDQVLDDHGTLQNMRPAQQFFQSDPEGRMVTQYIGQFSNGSANIAVTFAFDDDFTPQIDDVQVDGESPLPNP